MNPPVISAGDLVERPLPELLTKDERASILRKAEELWADLQANNLGGYSGINRPFYILHAFKEVIEKYGHRDVGLSWSKNDLDAARSALGEQPEVKE